MSVSLVIPTYNHGHYLPECLDSILQQEVQPKEILIVDDASTDCTSEVVASYQKKHPSVILLRNEKNLRPARSINRALSVATGDYIVGSAADDFLLPGFLKAGVEFLNLHPDLAFCCGDTAHFQDEKPYRFQFLKTLNSDRIEIFNASSIVSLFRGRQFSIQSHACMYRKSRMAEVGGFLPELESLCDWYLNISLALQWGFGYIPRPFAAYRLSGGSYANAVAKKPEARKRVLTALFEILDQPEQKWMKSRFQDSLVFSQFNYRYFFDFLRQPKYWKSTFPSFPKKLKNLISKRIHNLKWKIRRLSDLWI